MGVVDARPELVERPPPVDALPDQVGRVEAEAERGRGHRAEHRFPELGRAGQALAPLRPVLEDEPHAARLGVLGQGRVGQAEERDVLVGVGVGVAAAAHADALHPLHRGHVDRRAAEGLLAFALGRVAGDRLAGEAGGRAHVEPVLAGDADLLGPRGRDVDPAEALRRPPGRELGEVEPLQHARREVADLHPSPHCVHAPERHCQATSAPPI